MREVENINQQRERRPPRRYDEELYNCTEDLTADINEPRKTFRKHGLETIVCNGNKQLTLSISH